MKTGHRINNVASSKYPVAKRHTARVAIGSADTTLATYYRLPTTRRFTAFTLIELLTVIAIIGILAGLLLPAVGRARERAKVAQARADIKSIEAAVRAYYTEYGRWPVQTSLQGDASENTAAKQFGRTLPNSDLFNVLRSINAAPNANYVLNPRRIAFIEAKTTASTTDYGVAGDGVFRDPWGQPYIIVIDLNYDGNTDFGSPYGIQYSVGIVSLSLGSDKTLWSGSGANDDVQNMR